MPNDPQPASRTLILPGGGGERHPGQRHVAPLVLPGGIRPPPANCTTNPSCTSLPVYALIVERQRSSPDLNLEWAKRTATCDLSWRQRGHNRRPYGSCLPRRLPCFRPLPRRMFFPLQVYAYNRRICTFGSLLKGKEQQNFCYLKCFMS